MDKKEKRKKRTETKKINTQNVSKTTSNNTIKSATKKIIEENKKTKKPTPKKNNKEKTDNGFLIVLSCIALLLILFAYLFSDITTEKSLEEKCTSYQNDPYLNYTCTCLPTTRAKNESDIVDLKTDGLCTCYCDIGNNQTATIEVRVAN